MIAQHLILQKIDVIADYWEHQTLGLKFKIPFIEYEISLENEVLGGMIIANILKLLEIYVFAGNEGKPNVDPTKLGYILPCCKVKGDINKIFYIYIPAYKIRTHFFLKKYDNLLQVYKNI